MKTHRLQGAKPSPMRAMKVVLAPIVSEKSTMIGEKRGQVAFKVMQDATKGEVKAAIETLFKVDVTAVNVVNLKGKAKRFGQRQGMRQGSRKAYVSLKAGQEINFSETA